MQQTPEGHRWNSRWRGFLVWYKVLSLKDILKPKVSVSTSHWVPRARSQGNWWSRWSFTETALSDIGTDSMTLLELEIHLVNQNPPLESSARSSDTSDIALVLPLIDFKTIVHTKISPYSSHCLCAEHFLIIICRLL